MSLIFRIRALLLVVALGFALAGPATPVSAAPCVRVVGGNWNPSGNENYPPALNVESVKVKNVCSSTAKVGGWRLHDYGKKHIFTFPSTFKIGPGATVSVFSGQGTNTATKLYWGRSYGAIWNNTPPERAYLRNAAGTLVSSWSAYGTPSSGSTAPSDPYAAARAAGATAICRDGTWSFSQHRSGTCSWHGGVAVWL